MMKKTNKLFLTMCVAGSFALLFGSCKKNEDTQKVTINLPAFEEEVDGRAYIDFANGNKFMWNANDQILIYNLDNLETGNTSEKALYATDAAAEGRQLATFSYESGDPITAKKYGYFVFYPAAKAEAALLEGNYQTFTVPAEQTYTIDNGGTPTLDAAGMALACDLADLTDQFALKHIFGALKLWLTGSQNDKVTKIEVIDNRYNLSGNVTMKLHEVTMDQFQSIQTSFVGTEDPDNNWGFLTLWSEYKDQLGYSAEGEGKVMTLNCPEPVALDPEEMTLFPIGLRPGALKYGYTLKVYVEGQNDPYEFTYGNCGQKCIRPGVNKNIAVSLPY